MTDKSKGKNKEISWKRNQVFLFRVKNNFVKNIERYSLQVWNTAIQAMRTDVYQRIYKKYLNTFSSSSEEEHMENALALGADEGRDKLRKAAGSCK